MKLPHCSSKRIINRKPNLPTNTATPIANIQPRPTITVTTSIFSKIALLSTIVNMDKATNIKLVNELQTGEKWKLGIVAKKLGNHKTRRIGYEKSKLENITDICFVTRNS